MAITTNKSWRHSHLPVSLLVALCFLFPFPFPREAQADSVCAPWPDGLVCSPLNLCQGPGVCQKGDCVSTDMIPSGSICQISSHSCLDHDRCDGAGTCVAGAPRPSGTFCGPAANPCSGDMVCNATGDCIKGVGLPAGTICNRSTNPCVDDSVCDAMGECVAGTAKGAGTVCVGPGICRSPGQCIMGGTCVEGAALNEGKSCIGPDVCQSSRCVAGQCRATAVRDCSNGDRCLKKDSCIPGIGCVAVNICDLLPPADLLASMPDLTMTLDLSVRDMSPRDLSAMQSDMQGDLALPVDMMLDMPADAARADARMHPQDAASKDGPVPHPDLDAPDASVPNGTLYTLPLEITGGACQCQVGRKGAPGPNKLLWLIGLGLLLRRRRTLRSGQAALQG